MTGHDKVDKDIFTNSLVMNMIGSVIGLTRGRRRTMAFVYARRITQERMTLARRVIDKV